MEGFYSLCLVILGGGIFLLLLVFLRGCDGVGFECFKEVGGLG